MAGDEHHFPCVDREGYVFQRLGTAGIALAYLAEVDHGFEDSGFRIQDSGFGIRDSGFGIQDSGFRIRDSGFGIQDSGFGIEVSWRERLAVFSDS
jgi:hypothetical protein